MKKPSGSMVYTVQKGANTVPDLFVERRPQGDYAVRRAGSDRASVIEPTQREAIDRAKESDPKSKVMVERTRNTKGGNTDKWRAP